MNQGQPTRRRGDTFFMRLAGICFLVVLLISLAEPLFFGDKWTTRNILEIVFYTGFAATYLWLGFAPSKTRG